MSILFERVTAVTMERENPVLKDAYVLVDGGKIVSIGAEAPEGYRGERVDGRLKVLMPGLINSHTHVPMTVLRGYADGYDLHTWLNEHIFPAEAKFDDATVTAATNLGLAEMIASGTTSITEMYDHCDAIARSVSAAGLKANITRATTLFDDFDPASHTGAREAEALADAWHGHDSGRIMIDAGLHAEYTSNPPLWEWTAAFAKARGLRLHVHVSETEAEHKGAFERRGTTPLKALAAHGVLDVPVTAAHCVWVSDTDMALMAERGATAVHCPVSNMKLASGVARLTDMRAAGVNIALGTDGVASNNSHDLFEEIKAAALIHKATMRDPLVITAFDALEMATVNGAKGQGREGECGRIAPGYDADLILLDFDRPHLRPCSDVLSNLVFSARGSDVVMNMVRGKVIYKNGEHVTLDAERAARETDDALKRIRG